MTATTLKARLTSLVELSRTNPNAVEYLNELLREVGADRNAQTQVKLAIRHAERNAR
jgi:hypothetical protein